MAVNSFVENVNKLAISLYGDGTTPVDVSIITNNIEAITFLYDYISNGGEFGTIGASTVIENVDILPSVSTEGTIVYLNTNNKLYVYNGASWDEVGGGTIESTGGSITVVGTKPVSATLGDIIYLTTDGFLYTWDGTEWDKVGGGTTTSDTGIFVTDKPTTPKIGDTVLNILDGSVSTWDGTQWVVEEYTPHASSMTAVAMVSALPTTASEGDIVYNTTDDKMYVYLNGAWVAYFETITPNASGTGIGIVAELPLTATDGTVVFNSTDKKLYERVSGAWVAVVEATTAATDVADASITVAKFAAGIRPVETLSALPTTGNSVGRMVYLTTDGQLYRYTASGFTTAVPAQALTGTITATQIADDAITTPKIATGAITADEIGANAITAGKIAVGAVTAGTIQAGAISATEIASNAITTEKIYSGAITAIKLSANSVDATKIVAGSISASLIAADAINAGHIQAGAIGASEISAGAITADKIASKSITAAQIQAGAISSSEIASNAITADKILTGSITASKLSADAIIGKTIAITSATSATAGTTPSGHSSLALFDTSRDKNALAGINRAAGGYAVSGVSTNTTTSVGVHGVGNWGVLAEALGGGFGFYTAASCYFEGANYPFTGSHMGLTPNATQFQIGDIVTVVDGYMIEVNNSVFSVLPSSSIKDKKVIGVFNGFTGDIKTFAENSKALSDNEAFKPFIDSIKSTHKVVGFNAIGEGGITVCDKNGNIEIGDYICTSSLKGKGMKQDDDLLHNYTVAKALESVDWSKETTTSKMIACTYHCG